MVFEVWKKKLTFDISQGMVKGMFTSHFPAQILSSTEESSKQVPRIYMGYALDVGLLYWNEFVCGLDNLGVNIV